MPAEAPNGRDTSARLIAAAEELIADRGVDTVSLREISRAAGSRNVMAAQYWFTDRPGLLRALLDKHQPEVEARRHALLDAYEADARTDVRALSQALVQPWAPKLDQGSGGTAYLRVLAEQLGLPAPSLEPLDLDVPGSSLRRWSGLVAPLLDDEAVVMHRRFLVVRFVVSELALRARRSDRHADALFIASLTDLASGLLLAPVSDQVRHLRSSEGAGPLVATP